AECQCCCVLPWFILLPLRWPRSSTLFPYTTLFRSRGAARRRGVGPRGGAGGDSAAGRGGQPVLPHRRFAPGRAGPADRPRGDGRSEEHTSELQSRFDLVCRLLREKKKALAHLETEA